MTTQQLDTGWEPEKITKNDWLIENMTDDAKKNLIYGTVAITLSIIDSYVSRYLVSPILVPGYEIYNSVQGVVMIGLGIMGLLAARTKNFGLIITTYISVVTFIIIFLFKWTLYIFVNILNFMMIGSSYITVRSIHKGITTSEKEDKEKQSESQGEEFTSSKFTQTPTKEEKENLTPSYIEVNMTNQPQKGVEQKEIMKNDLLIEDMTSWAKLNLIHGAVAITVYIIDAHVYSFLVYGYEMYYSVQGIVLIALGSLGLLAASTKNIALIYATYISAIVDVLLLLFKWPVYIIVSCLNVKIMILLRNTMYVIHKGITKSVKNDNGKQSKLTQTDTTQEKEDFTHPDIEEENGDLPPPYSTVINMKL